jgi:membrane protein
MALHRYRRGRHVRRIFAIYRMPRATQQYPIGAPVAPPLSLQATAREVFGAGELEMSWLKRQAMLFVAAYNRWSEDEGPAMAAAVAYYVALSFFPLLLTLIAGIGLFFKFAAAGQDAQRAILMLVREHLSSSAETAVQQALTQVRDTSIFHGPIALVVMLFSSIASFVQLQQAFDRVGRVPAKHKKGIRNAVRMVLVERIVAFLMLCGLGALIASLFVGSLVLSATERYTTGVVPSFGVMRKPIQVLISFGVNAALFTLVYRWIPKNPASLRASFRGGLVAAAVWEIGRQILAEVLIGTKYSNAYGVVGSFIGLMLWCYYAVALLLLGAEYIQVISPRDGFPAPASGHDAAQSADTVDRLVN